MIPQGLKAFLKWTKLLSHIEKTRRVSKTRISATGPLAKNASPKNKKGKKLASSAFKYFQNVNRERTNKQKKSGSMMQSLDMMRKRGELKRIKLERSAGLCPNSDLSQK